MSRAAGSDKPVFGFVLFGGPLSGALVRDVRLANELADRGYAVHVWWVMDRPRRSPLRGGIVEHWLFHGMRHFGVAPASASDLAGRLFTRFSRDDKRARTVQKRPWILDRIMRRLMQVIARGVEHDGAVVRRFAREIDEAGVTHMLPMLEMLCLWARAARVHCQRPFKYVVTFQGYELYLRYAVDMGCDAAVREHLRQVVADSDGPAIAVSADYARRVHADIGVPLEMLTAIPPGVPVSVPDIRDRAEGIVQGRLKRYRMGVPLISFLGRRDTEKGIDLLLYAARILQQRGVEFQLAVCGPTLFGNQSKYFFRQLAIDLQQPVLWSDHITDEERSALFMVSLCIVYPSVHREPFGMVAVETMAHGTPAIVPNYGGIADAISGGGEVGGLLFDVWDSGSLADRIQQLLEDDALHARLAAAGPRVAAHYSVALLAERVLAHLGLVEPKAGDHRTDGDAEAAHQREAERITASTAPA